MDFILVDDKDNVIIVQEDETLGIRDSKSSLNSNIVINKFRYRKP